MNVSNDHLEYAAGHALANGYTPDQIRELANKQEDSIAEARSITDLVHPDSQLSPEDRAEIRRSYDWCSNEVRGWRLIADIMERKLRK